MVEVQVERKAEHLDNIKVNGQYDVEIICGDVVEEMKKLVAKGEKFDCVFADPDYNVGIRYGAEGCKTAPPIVKLHCDCLPSS
jgi:16S rRNA G966 N2-methylase RsmD